MVVQRRAGTRPRPSRCAGMRARPAPATPSTASSIATARAADRANSGTRSRQRPAASATVTIRVPASTGRAAGSGAHRTTAGSAGREDAGVARCSAMWAAAAAGSALVAADRRPAGAGFGGVISVSGRARAAGPAGPAGEPALRSSPGPGRRRPRPGADFRRPPRPAALAAQRERGDGDGRLVESTAGGLLQASRSTTIAPATPLINIPAARAARCPVTMVTPFDAMDDNDSRSRF